MYSFFYANIYRNKIIAWRQPDDIRHLQISKSVILINIVASTVCGIYQLLGVHVVQNPLSILTVMSTLHDSKETFRGIVLQFDNINNAVTIM